MEKAKGIAKLLGTGQSEGERTASGLLVKEGVNGRKHYVDEVEINDYPQKARYKVTTRETVLNITDMFGVAIVQKGKYIAGKVTPLGEKKLTLSLEGTDEPSVLGARRELTCCGWGKSA